MLHESLFIRAVASYLPSAVPVGNAIADGKYGRAEQAESGIEGITVAGPGESGPAMAVQAGRRAVRRSGLAGRDIDLLLHTVTAHNGLDGWNAGCYLQKEVLDGGGLSAEVRQLSNGAMACVELAAAYLTARPACRGALITAAEQFAEPAWDRWRTSWGLVFADGASAAVLSREAGFARVCSTVTVADPDLEGLHRGLEPFTGAPGSGNYPISLRARALDFARSMDPAEVGRRLATGLRTAVFLAAAEAGMSVKQADHYVVPSYGKKLLRRECLEPLAIPVGRSTWSWSAGVGHLGAADQFAALTHLAEGGRLAAGNKVLVIGIGGGFNWSCMVLDIVERPAGDCWAAQDRAEFGR